MCRLLLLASTGMTGLLGLLWLIVLRRAHKEQAASALDSLRHGWLPLLPAALAIICWEVLRWQQSTSNLLRTLKQSMYSYKSA